MVGARKHGGEGWLVRKCSPAPTAALLLLLLPPSRLYCIACTHSPRHLQADAVGDQVVDVQPAGAKGGGGVECVHLEAGGHKNLGACRQGGLAHDHVREWRLGRGWGIKVKPEEGREPAAGGGRQPAANRWQAAGGGRKARSVQRW